MTPIVTKITPTLGFKPHALIMTSTTMAMVPRPLTAEELKLAEERRLRLVAALEAAKVSQSELHRRLVDLDERTSLATVNRWCSGRYKISEVMLRGILTVIGLPADWKQGDAAPQ